ncbi:MAG: hypothetical protein ACD_73C00330G0002 [uncultured bacterium]|nr:MAG: hypothetical protein ACD_73C00330G0002 [uncultured bacterium]
MILNAKLGERIDFGPQLAIFRVVPDKEMIPDFKPGQFTTLGLPGTHPRCEGAKPELNPPKDPSKLILRAYSIASPPFEKDFMEFIITLVSEGTLTPRLWNLKAGDPLFLGPKITGGFIMNEVPDDKNIVFIATGTGIAPYTSMIKTFLSAKMKRHLSVFHGVRTSQDLVYRSELTALAHINEFFHYFPIISRPKEDPIPWKKESGHVQKLWETKVLETAWKTKPTPENTHVFLCGSPGMIDSMIELLGKDGFKEQIHVERYW